MNAGGARKMAQSENTSKGKWAPPGVSTGVWLAATVLRTLFICIVLLMVVAVSMPQSETIWSAYETPNDLIRMALGLAVCVWLVVQLLRGPADASAYRTWLYLGAVAVPFALVCLLALWGVRPGSILPYFNTLFPRDNIR
jgi:hypothetical protein